jgi:hypothetical protein
MMLALMLGSIYCCTEEEPEPIYSQGVLTGAVHVYENADPSNTKITARGPYGSSSTVSNVDGSYKLGGLGNGTYEVEFFKEGYGRIVEYGVQVFGNDTVYVYAWSLYKMADYNMPKLSTVLYYSAFPYMYEHDVAIVTDIPNDQGEQMQIRVFVSDQKNVSNKNYLHSDMAHASSRENGTDVMIFEANPQIVNSDGLRLFESGQTLYIIAYVCSVEEETGQFSEYYGLPIFSTVDENQHSPVIEIIAP